MQLHTVRDHNQINDAIPHTEKQRGTVVNINSKVLLANRNSHSQHSQTLKQTSSQYASSWLMLYWKSGQAHMPERDRSI